VDFCHAEGARAPEGEDWTPDRGRITLGMHLASRRAFFLVPMTTPSDPSVPARPADAAQNEDRRRFVKAGLIAAPLIVTLTARPAWASVSNTTMPVRVIRVPGRKL